MFAPLEDTPVPNDKTLQICYDCQLVARHLKTRGNVIAIWQSNFVIRSATQLRGAGPQSGKYSAKPVSDPSVDVDIALNSLSMPNIPVRIPALLFPALLATLALLGSGCIHKLERLEGRPPPQPTGLEALGLPSAIQISWDEPRIRVPHDLYFTPEGGEEDVIRNITNPYVHQNLVNGQLYTYQVVARNSVGESPRSAPVTAMPVIFNWQELWNINNLAGNNHPLCSDDGTSTQCLIITTANSWATSREHGGTTPNATIGEALTYLRFSQNFTMVAGDTTYTMRDDNGLNMTVESPLPSFLALDNLNIPVTTYTELFILDHEAVLTDDSVYTYLEILPATFVAGDACLGRKLRYVLAKGGSAAITPPDADTRVIELGQIDDLFRRNILPDLACNPSAYAIGSIRLGIENPQSSNNWARWGALGIIGPPLT